MVENDNDINEKDLKDLQDSIEDNEKQIKRSQKLFDQILRLKKILGGD